MGHQRLGIPYAGPHAARHAHELSHERRSNGRESSAFESIVNAVVQHLYVVGQRRNARLRWQRAARMDNPATGYSANVVVSIVIGPASGRSQRRYLSGEAQPHYREDRPAIPRRFINAFNSPQFFSGPIDDVNNANFGRVSGAMDQSNLPRFVQLSMKLQF